jgi:hypothetical protein
MVNWLGENVDMRLPKILNWRTILSLAIVALFIGCETSDNATVTHAYYGAGVYDPWYYGDAYYGHDHDHDIVVTPPGGNPRPSHPIANPPASSGPRPTPMPSIPHAAPRGGGGGRR